jgi:hypothetical protein
MPRYRIITLVDITRTNEPKSSDNELKKKQQSNFDSLRQTIELRSNVEWTRDPKKEDGRLPEDINGKAVHWLWDFSVEREDVFLKGNNPVGLLEDDLHGVPIINDLENSAEIALPAIQTRGKSVNTWIKII